MADEQTIGTAYLTVKAKPDGSFGSDVGSMGAEAGDIAGGLFNGKFGAMLKKLPGIIAALGVAKEISEAVIGTGEEFDKMTDSIIIGTGASGEALEGLRQSAMNIGKTVPADFEAVGDVVQNLNTRLGMSGDELEKFGAQVIAAGNMLGKEVNLDTLTGAFNAFGVANDQAADKLDYLFNVGQATGIALNDLTAIMESNAPTMMNLGFTFEETANMAGLLDKAGMDANGTMSKMSKALVSLSQPGENAAQTYRRVLGELQSFIEAGDTASAIDLASKVFGTKGAAQFVGALQSGALSMEEIQNAALGAGDGIMETMEKTMDWDESLQILKNSVMVAFEPFTSGVLEWLAGIIQAITGFVQEHSAAFENLGGVLTVVWDVFTTLVTPALETVGTVIGTVVEAVGTLAGWFTSLWETAKEVWNGIVETIEGAINTIKGLFDFELEFPHIDIPHFGVDGAFSADPPSVPDFYVSYYAKGGIIDAPQLFVAGEAGAEAIVPLTTPNVMPFADAVASLIGGKGGDTYITMNVTADSTTTLDNLVAQARRARALNGGF